MRCLFLFNEWQSRIKAFEPGISLSSLCPYSVRSCKHWAENKLIENYWVKKGVALKKKKIKKMKQFIRRWKRKVWWFDLGQLTKLLSVPLLLRTVGDDEYKSSRVEIKIGWLLTNYHCGQAKLHGLQENAWFPIVSPWAVVESLLQHLEHSVLPSAFYSSHWKFFL